MCVCVCVCKGKEKGELCPLFSHSFLVRVIMTELLKWSAEQRKSLVLRIKKYSETFDL